MVGKKILANETDICIGEMIKIMRIRQGLTQTDLARALGVTFQQIQKYECANSRIAASRLYQIANLMKIPVGRFFNEMDSGCIIDSKTAEIIRKIYAMSADDRAHIFWLVNRMFK